MAVAGETEVPDYRGLYYRWEREQWEAGAVELAEDRRQWANDLSPEVKRSILAALGPSYVGADEPTHLAAFIDAAPTEEQQVFLTTQLADEARRAVFLDRVRSEVLAPELPRRAGSTYERLVLETLPAATAKIRSDDGDLVALVEGVTVYHLLMEGSCLLTGHHSLIGLLADQDLLPGLRAGLTAVTRDQSRHLDFGTRFLSEMVAADPRYKRAIEDVVRSIVPGDLDRAALDSLARRMRTFGVELEV